MTIVFLLDVSKTTKPSLRPSSRHDSIEVETHSFKFAIPVSDDQHPSSLSYDTSEPLVGVI